MAVNGSLSHEFPRLLKPNLGVAGPRTVLPSDLGMSRDIFKKSIIEEDCCDRGYVVGCFDCEQV